jgi:ATP-binding cassette subfamily C protein
MDTNIVKKTVDNLQDLELFLLHLRYRGGRLLNVEGNKPILLNDPESAWVVYSGTIDLFSVPVEGDTVVGTRTHLFRSDAGQLLLGIDGSAGESDVSLLVSGTPGTRILQLQRSKLLEMAENIEYESLIVSMLNDWVTALSLAVFNEILPKDYLLLEPGHELELNGGDPTTITPRKKVVWLYLNQGQLQLVGNPHLSITAPARPTPVAQFAWLQVMEPSRMVVRSTEALLSSGQLWPSLEQFHRLVLAAVVLQRTQRVGAELERLRKKAQSERMLMENALLRLGSTLNEEITFIKSLDAGPDALVAAYLLVAEAEGIDVTIPTAAATKGLRGFELLTKVTQASRVRMREVALRGKGWKRDNGPLLAFTAEEQPVALIRGSRNNYEMVDPVRKVTIAVNAEVAGRLTVLAYSFYRPLPAGHLNGWQLIKFGLKNNGADLRHVLLIGVGLGLLRLLPPVATGYIFNNYIPRANVAGLVQMGIALLVVALVGGFLHVAQGVSLLRIQSRMDASIQAALWNRLLNLPLPFFRRFAAGNLGDRVMGITTIRRILSGRVLNSILTFLFTSFNLALLFVYSVPLALLAMVLIAFASLVLVGATVVDVKHQRNLTEARGDLSGLLLQLLTGIVKLRMTASEKPAFALWTEQFVKQNKLYFRARQLMNKLTVFNSVYPLFSSLSIFAIVGYSSAQANLSTGDFLAFNLAFIQFLTAWVQMANSVSAVAVTVPLYERLKPILEMEPEVNDVKISPQTLSGAIEISRVSFRYSEKSPLVIKDVSLNIGPGEFVAFVGHSGSGKSTLLRLLLGFETPETGGIYYDGQDLADLDLREVRRQLGVVLQNSALLNGDIYDNIVGASELTVEDAWEAAEMVGLAEDVRKMPMGMHTVITGHGGMGTLSGGQRQRIMIARAIVNRPRLLFFDEATSALDNRTQEIVSESLENLQATRIVIAHRLSTIVNADRIFVLDRGEVVQSGSYDELLRQPGPFADLSARQMV